MRIPIYVTRKDAHGVIASWSINVYAGVAALVFAQVNALLWGIVGVKTAVEALI